MILLQNSVGLDWDIRNLSAVFNWCEAGLWLVIAMLIGVQVLRLRFRRTPVPAYQSVAAVAFAVFGVSDIIESFTGAWWTPWWLFVMKAGCVLAFIFCFMAYRKAVKDTRGTG